VGDKRNHGEEQQQVDQEAGHVKQQETQDPYKEQQYCDPEKRPESHSLLLKPSLESAIQLQIPRYL
jgi:hypothetical protein